MSKARSMYAGSSGYNYSVNKNSPGNGNGKWQGLWPSVGHARNTRYINTRAGGDNRDVVFCMNQLGGVGRKSNMFATTADGVKEPCHNGLNNKSALENAIEILWHYFLKYDGNGDGIPDGSFILVGAKETLTSDNVAHPEKFQSIKHFDKQHPEYYNLPSDIQRQVDIVNRAGFSGPLKPGGPDVPHIVGWASAKAQNALLSNGFGRFIPIGTRSVFMFQKHDVGPLINVASSLGIGTASQWIAYSRLPNARDGDENATKFKYLFTNGSYAAPEGKDFTCSAARRDSFGWCTLNNWGRAEVLDPCAGRPGVPTCAAPSSNTSWSKTTPSFIGYATNKQLVGYFDIGPYAGLSPEGMINNYPNFEEIRRLPTWMRDEPKTQCVLVAGGWSCS